MAMGGDLRSRVTIRSPPGRPLSSPHLHRTGGYPQVPFLSRRRGDPAGTTTTPVVYVQNRASPRSRTPGPTPPCEDQNNAPHQLPALPERPALQRQPPHRRPHQPTKSTASDRGTGAQLDLIDIPTAFDTYREPHPGDGRLPGDRRPLVDDQGTTLPRPIPSRRPRTAKADTGEPANVLTLFDVDLSRHCRSHLHPTSPSASTPILINVTGHQLPGATSRTWPVSPWQPGPVHALELPETQTTIVVNGGATIEGTLYAPRRDPDMDSVAEHRGQHHRPPPSTTGLPPGPSRRPPRGTRLPVQRQAVVRVCSGTTTHRDAHSREEGHQRRQRHGPAVGLDAGRRGADADVRVGRDARRTPGAAGPGQLPADRGRAWRLRQSAAGGVTAGPWSGTWSPSPTATT